MVKKWSVTLHKKMRFSIKDFFSKCDAKISKNSWKCRVFFCFFLSGICKARKKKSENNLKKRKKNTTVFWTSNNDNLKDILLKQSDIWKSRYAASSWNYWSLYYHRICFKKEKNEKVIESISVFVTLSTYTTSRHKYLKSCTQEDR